ncbi:TetR family transcriptional regulator [Streptomyces sp. NPDC006997]|uniref:TetR family transcriptional regulator n=1 Tax=Streptomyces sp. NPDC006997 TaxID=3155356 RepID=UPI0033DED28E
MAKQERALKTRHALVRAAATRFDRDGYAGASLSQIRDAARISMGALTFHFSSKAELADAIEGGARAMIAEVVEQVSAKGTPSLDLAVELTLELTRLLEEQEMVRAAARLARERPGSPEWSSAWVPALRRMLEQLQREGSLRPPASPERVAALAACLVEGMDIVLRRRADPATASTVPVSAVEELAQMWGLILTGLRPGPSG